HGRGRGLGRRRSDYAQRDEERHHQSGSTHEWVRNHCQRMWTLIFGYSGDLPSTSTMRRLLSGASRRRLLLLNETILPQSLGIATSYRATCAWAEAGSGSHGRAASTVRASAMIVSTVLM